MLKWSKPGLDTLLYLNKLPHPHGGSLFSTSSGRNADKVATGSTSIEDFDGLKRRGGRKTAERETLLVGLRESHVENYRDFWVVESSHVLRNFSDQVYGTIVE